MDIKEMTIEQQAYNIGYIIGTVLGYFIIIGIPIGLYVYLKKRHMHKKQEKIL